MAILIIISISVVFFVFSAAGLYLPDRAVYRDAPPKEFTAYLDYRIQKIMKCYAIPGVNIALVQDGEIVYRMAYGYANKEADRKMTIDMPMRVQSISKSVTAWAVLKLVDEGKISLDEPVGKYINDWTFPKSNYNTDGVTIRRLLSHTAGLPLGDIFTLYSPSEHTPSLKDSLTESATLFQDPGKGFSYSNVGYNLLELLIEEVTGQNFAEYMSDEILKPLEMNHSTFEWNAETIASAPLGYTLSGKSVQPYRYPEKASGGLLSTTEDIARFCIAGMGHYSKQEILSPAGVEQLYSSQVGRLGIYSLVFDAYGMGYYTERGLAVSHGGQGTGWMSHFHSVPETGDAIVILTNSQRSWPLIAGITQWLGTMEGLTGTGYDAHPFR